LVNLAALPSQEDAPHADARARAKSFVSSKGLSRKSPMNRVLLSLCLFGAALATASALIMLRPACPSAGAWAVAADKDAPAAKPEAAPATKSEIASPAAEIKPANFAFWTEPSQAPKMSAMLRALPKDADVTGSVKGTAKTDQNLSAEAGAKMPGDPDLAATARPERQARPYRSRKYGWKRYYRPPPPMGFAIRVYPGW
jgi:hypothetical protein